MSIWEYSKDYVGEIVTGGTFYGIMLLSMSAFRCSVSLIIFLSVLYFLAFFLIFFMGFFRKKKFFDELTENLKLLDQKYFVSEMVSEPGFYEGRLIYEAIYEIDKSMCENVKKYRESVKDFKDYVEMWVHEVKLPIASLFLMCHNDGEERSKKYAEQIRRLDRYTDQILYYIRSEHAEKDYMIKEVHLEKAVSAAALKNREDLLGHNINLQAEHLDWDVFTDGKWLEFMLTQIFNNSIKYRAAERQSCIRVWAEESSDCVVLHIRDNGIGIPASDLPSVFEKSFTGENGRIRAKSTGMGLYIVKQLCDRLGHKIEIQSEQGKYTEIAVIFGKHDYYFREGEA